MPQNCTSGYMLPFPDGKDVVVTQGNDSPFSHTGKARFAYDFVPLPDREGGVIVAASAGTVSMWEDSHPDGSDRSNYLVIRSSDGFCDLYLHLKHASVSEFGLTVGALVARGQQICRVGSTGRVTGPHLHFQRQICGDGYWQQSVPLCFEDVDENAGVPIEGKHYSSRNTMAQPLSLRESLQGISARQGNHLLRPAQAFGQFAQQHRLGAPLSGILQSSGPDQRSYLFQVFAADTLYLPLPGAGLEPDWQDIHRMTSLLVQNLNSSLGLFFWAKTYANANLEFNPRWASHQFVLSQVATNHLGAPLGGGSVNGVHILHVGGKQYEAEIYAHDTIYWAPPNWGDIRRMSAL